MSGICGWLNGQREADPAHATLDTMRQALRERDSAGPQPIVSTRCALAVETGIRPVSLHRTETLLAAVYGCDVRVEPNPATGRPAVWVPYTTDASPRCAER